LLRRDGQPAGEAVLHYAGTVSEFEGTVTVEAPGAWEAIVYAWDPANGNTGVDAVTFIVAP